MTNREEIEAICASNQFMKLLGIHTVDVGGDRAVLELTAQPILENPYGIVHGGALYTLADCACGMAARGDGRSHVTLSSSFNFLRPGRLGDTIRATATVRRRGGSTCYVEVEVTDSAGELLCGGNSTFYCIEK